MFSKGLQYLTNYLDYLYDLDDNYYYDLEDKAFAAYILARNGIVVSGYLTALEEKLEKLNKPSFNWKNSMAAAYIGASYILLKNEERGKELLISSAPEYYEYKFNGDYRNSLLDNAIYNIW